MSLAPSYPLHSAAPASKSWRRFQKAFALTGAAVFVACVVYAVEKYLFRPRHRFIESPAEVMMRAFAFAHFLVGWFFLFTSSRLRQPSAAVRLIAATLCGLGACWLFGALGGDRAPLVLVGFYSLFLIHETRDECALARAGGDIPAHSPFADALVHCVTLLLITLLAGAYLVRGFVLEPSLLNDLSGVGILAAWSVVALFTAIFALRAMIAGRRHHGTLHAALEAHLPLVQIYQALILILLFGSMLGSVGLNVVILLHVSVWFVFVLERPGDANAEPPKNLVAWLRNSKPCFLAMHLGLIVVLLVLMALRVQVWMRAGWGSAILSSASFPYWSLMHICMAFGVKK